MKLNIKNFVILLIPLILLILIQTSCSDFLDPEPDGSMTEKMLFADPQSARGFLNNIYTYIPSGFYSLEGAMQACITDEAKSRELTGATVSMTDGSMSARNFAESWMWSNYYTGIRKATIFLENVDEATFATSTQQALDPQINERYRQQYKGEAWFLKGLFYFELIKRFGGVPVLPEKRLLVTDDLAGIPRSSYDECVAYIVKCCDTAAGLLPNSYVATGQTEMLGRANRASACALKSRALLYAASILNNPSNDMDKWKAAAEASKVVLDMPEYGLLDSKLSAWNRSLQIWTEPNNKEVLFATSAQLANTIERAEFPKGLKAYAVSSGQGMTHPTHDLVKAFQMADGSDAVWPESGGSVPAARDLYRGRDPRFAYWIFYNGCRPYDSDLETLATGVGQNSGLDKDATYTHTGYYLSKFVNRNANIQVNGNMLPKSWVIFRYAEILLNYAEAMNEAYGPVDKPAGYILSALDALNEVRTRAGMPVYENNKPVTQPDLREGIRHERRIELCFEEHRYWDLKRWKLATAVLNGTIHGIRIQGNSAAVDSWEEFEVEDRVFTEKMNLYPIPYSELLKSGMEQNPGWEAPEMK